MATRGLTTAQAVSGFRPPIQLAQEWRDMYAASLFYEQCAKTRSQLALQQFFPDTSEAVAPSPSDR